MTHNIQNQIKILYIFLIKQKKNKLVNKDDFLLEKHSQILQMSFISWCFGEITVVS